MDRHRKGLYRYDGENFLLFNDLPQKHAILCITQDNQGQIWTGSLNGDIQVIDIKRGIAKTVDKKVAFSLLNVNRILIDDRQRVWTASWSQGVSIINLQANTITYLGRNEGLSSNQTPGMVQDGRHNIWISSNSKG